MTNPKLLLISLCSLFVVCRTIEAKDWRDIRPLTSTRVDVIRLFKQCTDNNPSCEFKVEGSAVHLEFSMSSGEVNACPKPIPRDTLLLVEVTPDKSLRFQSLRLNSASFKPFKLNPAKGPNYQGYMNERIGLILKTFEGKIVQLEYIPELKARQHCEGYYRDPQSFVKEIFLSHYAGHSTQQPSANSERGEEVDLYAAIQGRARITYSWDLNQKVYGSHGSDRGVYCALFA